MREIDAIRAQVSNLSDKLQEYCRQHPVWAHFSTMLVNENTFPYLERGRILSVTGLDVKGVYFKDGLGWSGFHDYRYFLVSELMFIAEHLNIVHSTLNHKEKPLEQKDSIASWIMESEKGLK